jgi:hypothetical protein
MAAQRARIERRVWDRDSQHFAATGETIEGEVSALEQLANHLSGSRRLFLNGPVPVALSLAPPRCPARR